MNNLEARCLEFSMCRNPDLVVSVYIIIIFDTRITYVSKYFSDPLPLRDIESSLHFSRLVTLSPAQK